MQQGDRITLKGNEEEGWPEQPAIFQFASGYGMAVVTVTPDPDDPLDDGIREVDMDQIKP